MLKSSGSNMKVIIDEAYSSYKEEIFQALDNFEKQGRKIGPGKRNVLKAITLDQKEVNVKAFKIPNAVNKIAYRFLENQKPKDLLFMPKNFWQGE